MSGSKQPHGDHDFTGPLSPGVSRFLSVFLVLCGILLLLDLVGIKREDEMHLGAEGWFAFYPAYGFLGCVLLVLIAKEMRKVLMRPEDHYDPPEEFAVDPQEGETTIGSDWSQGETNSSSHGQEGGDDGTR